METFVLVASMVIGEDRDVFAHGPFRTESNCWQFLHILTLADREFDVLLGTCMTLDDYKRNYSHLWLKDGDT